MWSWPSKACWIGRALGWSDRRGHRAWEARLIPGHHVQVVPSRQADGEGQVRRHRDNQGRVAQSADRCRAARPSRASARPLLVIVLTRDDVLLEARSRRGMRGAQPVHANDRAHVIGAVVVHPQGQPCPAAAPPRTPVTTMTRNSVPNPDACATTGSDRTEADTGVRYPAIRPITSDHVRPRVASRPHCSVATSRARTEGETPGGLRRPRALVKLVHTIGILACDTSLTAPDAMRRIRDALGTFYGAFDDPDEA